MDPGVGARMPNVPLLPPADPPMVGSAFAFEDAGTVTAHNKKHMKRMVA